MLPMIGIMIGFYIILRCLSFLTREGAYSEHLLVKIFSVITILVTLLIMLSLLTSGTPALPHR